MSNQNIKEYHLVTSADKRTWSKYKTNLLLGPWCKVISDNNSLNQDEIYKYEILDNSALPFFNQKNDNDFYSKNIEVIEMLTTKYVQLLNNYHDKTFSEKYWKIIILPWILSFSQIFSDINIKLDEGFKKYNISSVTFFKISKQCFNVPKDYNESYSLLRTNDRIINLICKSIISYNNYSVEIDHIDIKYLDKNINKLKPILYNKLFFRDFIRIFILKIFNYFPVFNSQALIIGSMLPFYSEAILQMSNLQFPKHWKETTYDRKNISLSDRLININGYFKNNSSNSLDEFIFALSTNFFPMAYLEDYIFINNLKNTINWPKKPKYILTSGYIYSFELLKFYCAEKKEVFNTPLYLTQHGNHYLTRKMINVESEIADKFIIWGNKKIDKKNYFTAFMLKSTKVLNKKNYIKNNNKDLLFIISTPEKNKSDLLGWDLNNYEKNYQFMFKTIELLNQYPRNNLKLRLRNEITNEFCGCKDKIKKFDKSIYIDEGQIPIKRLFLKSKLIVHGYDSTGVLESLNMNIPTLFFFHEYEFEQFIDEEVTNDYNDLINLGILYLNSEELSAHINNIWGNISDWWYSKDIQNGVSKFCNKYAKRTTRPNKTLMNLINNE